jgi:hypothetical protein
VLSGDGADDKGYSYRKRHHAAPLCVTKGTIAEIVLAEEAYSVDCSRKSGLAHKENGG